ncbi:MAG: DUF2232 domain-containing protein [Cellulosilyticaceae bacterium]
MQNFKDWLKLSLLLTFYVVLGFLGIYSNTLIFLFPLTAIPLTIYLMGSKKDMRRELALHILVVVGIYLVSGDYTQTILYVLSVVVPTYLAIRLYRQQLTVPQIMMTIGVTMGGVLIVYVVGMKFMGIDYVQQYMDFLDYYQKVQLDVFNNMAAAPNLAATFTSEEIDLVKDVLKAQVSVFKLVYPALFLLISLCMSMIYIGIITLVGKVKGWRLPTLKQLFYFRFSRIAAALVIVGMLVIQLDRTQEGIFTLLGFNLYFLLNSLFQLIGVVAAIMIIRKSKMASGFKTMGILVSIIIFYTMPLAMTIVGIGDSLFNYRKLENVV